MRKLGGHFILKTPQGQALARRSNIVKAFRDPWPFYETPDHAVRIWREYLPDAAVQWPAEVVCEAILSPLKGYNHPRLYVETLNEQKATVEALRGIVAILHARGYKVAGPSLGTGAYGPEDWAEWRQIGFDLVAVHCYWADYGFTIWNALRWRQYWQPGDPLVVITECGRDRVRDGDTSINDGYVGKAGWMRDGVSAEQYLAEGLAYGVELDGDPRVLGANLFTAGPTDDWNPFGIDSICERLAAQIEPADLLASAGLGNPPAAPQPEEAPPVTLSATQAGILNQYVEWVQKGGDGSISSFLEHRATVGQDSPAAAIQMVLAALAGSPKV